LCHRPCGRDVGVRKLAQGNCVPSGSLSRFQMVWSRGAKERPNIRPPSLRGREICSIHKTCTVVILYFLTRGTGQTVRLTGQTLAVLQDWTDTFHLYCEDRPKFSDGQRTDRECLALIHCKPSPFDKQFCMPNTAVFTSYITFKSYQKKMFQSKQMGIFDTLICSFRQD
jgi:hypothetical protein